MYRSRAVSQPELLEEVQRDGMGVIRNHVDEQTFVSRRIADTAFWSAKS